MHQYHVMFTRMIMWQEHGSIFLSRDSAQQQTGVCSGVHGRVNTSADFSFCSLPLLPTRHALSMGADLGPAQDCLEGSAAARQGVIHGAWKHDGLDTERLPHPETGPQAVLLQLQLWPLQRHPEAAVLTVLLAITPASEAEC